MGDEAPRQRATKAGAMSDLDIVRRYVAGGVGIRALVTESGLSYGTLHKRLAAAGVLRARGLHAPASRDRDPR
jgi:hypothetical protein